MFESFTASLCSSVSCVAFMKEKNAKKQRKSNFRSALPCFSLTSLVPSPRLGLGEPSSPGRPGSAAQEDHLFLRQPERRGQGWWSPGPSSWMASAQLPAPRPSPLVPAQCTQQVPRSPPHPVSGCSSPFLPAFSPPPHSALSTFPSQRCIKVLAW